MNNIYNNIKITDQTIYDTYNSLMFTDDIRVFQKMTKKIELYLKTQYLIGDIVEFGVFKGASMSLWLKLRDMYEHHSITKVIGFDFFNPTELLQSLEPDNKSIMSKVMERVDNNELTIDSVNDKLKIFKEQNYILIKGDAAIKSKEFKELNPGFRIKLLYMDLDLGKPTLEVLKNLWNNVVIGGVVIFDEYAYHIWDESIGVDTFLKSIKNKYKLFKTDIIAPTMYIIKTN